MSRFSFSSLRSRLLLLVLLAVIPALGLALYSASEDCQREVSHIEADALRLAQIVSVEEEQLIRGTRQLLVALAEMPQVRDGDSTLCSAFFAELLKDYHRYDNFGAIEPDGDVFCSALPTSGPVNAADRGYFQRALQTRDFAIGHYQIGRITGKPSINFGYPVLDEAGQVQAVVFAALDLDWLNQCEYELTAQLPQGSTLTKIDRDGVVLVHEPDPEKWVGQPALEMPLAQTVLAQGPGAVEAVGLDGTPGVYAFAPLPSALYARDMYVIIGIPEDVAFAEVNRVLARNLAGLGLVTVLALATAWAFGDVFILRQVNALLQATKRLSGGDLSARIALPPGQGELGQLARAFDQMAEALERRAAERKRAEEALRLKREILETLADFDQEIMHLDMHRIVGQALDFIEKRLGVHHLSIALLESDQSGFRLLDVRVDIDEIQTGRFLPLNSTVLSKVVRGDEPVYRSDIRKEKTKYEVDAVLIRGGIRSDFLIPLVVENKCIGTLNTSSREVDGISEERRQLLTLLAPRLAQALQNAHLFESLEESEERYRDFIEGTDNLVTQVNSAGRFTFVNHTAQQVFGLSPEGCIGLSVFDFIHPDDWEKTRLAVEQWVKNKVSSATFENRQVSRTGEVRDILWSINFHFDNDENFIYNNAIGRDITERKRSEEALRQYAERLRILREADQAILAVQSPQAIAQAVLSRIAQLVPCQRVGITLFDFEGPQLIVLAVHFTGETQVEAGMRLPLEWFGGDIEMLRQGSVQVIEDVLALPQPAQGLQILQAEGWRSFTVVPLISRGELVGSLNLVLNSPGGLAPEYVEIAREVADSLAVAIQNARLLEQVHAGRERLQTLSRRLMEVQEVERHHIARELHDEIGQALTSLKINLQAVQRSLDTPALAPHLGESIRTVDRTLQQVRDLSLDLRPSLLDDLGLVPALRWHVDRQAQQAELSAQFAADLLEKRLPPDLEIVCFRIVQEALTNVIRHAQAQRVRVELRQREDELQLIVRDDGVGFDVQAALDRAAHGASMGLLGMEERALLLGGQIEIKSEPGRGTEIRACFPLTLSPSPEEGNERGGL